MGYGITVNIISAGPEETPMLDKLSFDLNPGEQAVITGASGSGKTTLLRILAGLMNYRGRVGYINAGYLKTGDDERKITTNTDNTTIIGKTSTVAADLDNISDTEKKGTDTGLDLSSTSHRSSKSDCRDNTISPKELLQMGGISMLFQENRLLPELSAIDNLRVALPTDVLQKSCRIKSSGEPKKVSKSNAVPNAELSKSDKKKLLRQIISEELEHILPGVDLDKPVSQLSGGEQRRVALARALVQDATVVLLDEPFTGLDVASAELVRQYISDKGNGKTLLLSEHEGEHFPEWKRIEIK